MIDSRSKKERIAAVRALKTNRFIDVAKASGLDPAISFKFMDLRGWDFSESDLDGFDFSGAIFDRSQLDNLLKSGAIFDVTDWYEAKSPKSAKNENSIFEYFDAIDREDVFHVFNMEKNGYFRPWKHPKLGYDPISYALRHKKINIIDFLSNGTFGGFDKYNDIYSIVDLAVELRREIQRDRRKSIIYVSFLRNFSIFCSNVLNIKYEYIDLSCRKRDGSDFLILIEKFNGFKYSKTKNVYMAIIISYISSSRFLRFDLSTNYHTKFFDNKNNNFSGLARELSISKNY